MKMQPGLEYFPYYLSKEQINQLLKDIEYTIDIAPLFNPVMPKTGRKFSAKMSNMGKVGWVSDQIGGYRYQKHHPTTNKKWPKISNNILAIWHELTKLKAPPDCCLINYYDSNAKMGLHVDNDEKDFFYPVLSISIGNSALFRFGGLQRSDKTKSIKLNNGDILIMRDESRLIYHGIDRIYQSNLFNYRINLTLRKI